MKVSEILEVKGAAVLTVKPSDSIEGLVDSSVEFVTPDDPIEKVSRLVTSGKTPLVNDPTQSGKLLAILTKIDLLTYLGNRI